MSISKKHPYAAVTPLESQQQQKKKLATAGSSVEFPSLTPFGLYPCRQRWKQLWKMYWTFSWEKHFYGISRSLHIFTDYMTDITAFSNANRSKAHPWKWDTFLICSCKPVNLKLYEANTTYYKRCKLIDNYFQFFCILLVHKSARSHKCAEKFVNIHDHWKLNEGDRTCIRALSINWRMLECVSKGID